MISGMKRKKIKEEDHQLIISIKLSLENAVKVLCSHTSLLAYI